MARHRKGKFLQNLPQIMGGIKGAFDGASAGVQGASSQTYDDVVYEAPSSSSSWFNKNTWFLPTLGISAVVLFILRKK